MPIIEFYEEPNGKCPVKEFLDSIPRQYLPEFEYKFDLLEEHGYKLQRPHVGMLDNGLFELRISVKHNQWRIVFFYSEGKIILSHGFRKESKTNYQPHKRLAKEHERAYNKRSTRQEKK